MKLLQELKTRFKKITDFSHSRDSGGKNDWTRSREVSRGTGDPVDKGRGKGGWECVQGQVVKGLCFMQQE